MIQDNASTTSNEEFLKLWAKLYTEEACNPNSISRRTIKLVETLDINIIKLLENNIFPYCDEKGFYWGNQHDISSLILLQDYNLIENNAIGIGSKTFNSLITVKLNQEYTLYCYPSYGYSAQRKGGMYRLTNSALQIYQNINKVKNNEQQNLIIFKNINEASKSWNIDQYHIGKIKFKTKIKQNEKYVICNCKGEVIQPVNSRYKNLTEFKNIALNNIELIKYNKQIGD